MHYIIIYTSHVIKILCTLNDKSMFTYENLIIIMVAITRQFLHTFMQITINYLLYTSYFNSRNAIDAI